MKKMRRMAKAVVPVLLTLSAVFSLTACSGNSNITVSPKESPSDISAIATGSAVIASSTPEGNTPETSGDTVWISPSPVTSPSGNSSEEPVAVTGISVSEKTVQMYVNDSTTLTVEVLPANATNRRYSVSVSPENVVRFENGVLTAVASGTATLTFRTQDGNFTETVTVNVATPGEVYPASCRYDKDTGLPNYTPVFEDGVEYYEYSAKKIKHIFSHDLVAFADPTEHFFKDCLTVKEFKAILEQLYKNNYVLIDIDYMYEYKYEGDVMTAALKNTVKVPKGKIPLVLSVDNVAYPEDNYSSARVSGLQVVNGELKTFVRNSNGSITYVEDGDAFPILEEFIKEHPDFSFSGAKCVVCPSGTWGVFGWDTHLGAVNYEANLAEARKVAQWFADHGYAFACHSYYHKGVDKMTVAEIEEDFAKWNAEVYPIVGRTHVYIYPLGALPQYGFNKPMVEQGQALIDAGYSVFCGTALDSYSATNYLFKGTAFIERVTLTSWSIIRYKDDSRLTVLFDPYVVYDNDAHSQKIS